MATQAEIRVKVLNSLGVTKPGQSVTTSDAAIVDARYNELHYLYSEKNVIYWALADETPDEAVIPFVKILTDECKYLFHHLVVLPERRINEIKLERIQAEKDLRLLNNVDYQPSPTPFEDF